MIWHPDPFVLLVVALAGDLVFGETRWLPGPWVLIHRLAQRFDRRLNRIERSDPERRRRGVALMLGLVLISALLGWGLDRWARKGAWPAHLAETVIIFSCLSMATPWRRVSAVARALESDELGEARGAVRPLTFRPVHTLDSHGVARAAVEGLAKILNQKLVTPILCYGLAGLPGLLAWTALDAVDAAIGHRSPRYAWFGQGAAWSDTVVNFIPARLTAALVILAAAFIPRTQPWNALRALPREAGKHRSRNGGWPEAAFAGALGVSLSGPRREGEVLVREAWVGEGRARVSHRDLYRAQGIYVVAVLLVVGMVGVAMLLMPHRV